MLSFSQARVELPKRWASICREDEPGKYSITFYPIKPVKWGIHDLNTSMVRDTEKPELAKLEGLSLIDTAKIYLYLKANMRQSREDDVLNDFPLRFDVGGVVALSVEESLEIQKVFPAV